MIFLNDQPKNFSYNFSFILQKLNLKQSKEKFRAKEAIHAKIESNPSRTVLFLVNFVSISIFFGASGFRSSNYLSHYHRTSSGNRSGRFFLRHDKKLTPHRFFHRHLSYLSVFESFLTRL